MSQNIFSEFLMNVSTKFKNKLSTAIFEFSVDHNHVMQSDTEALLLKISA